MSKLNRPIYRETAAIIRDRGRSRPLCITLTNEGIYLRQKRSRLAYLLPWEAAYSCAVKLETQRQRREKQKAKR